MHNNCIDRDACHEDLCHLSQICLLLRSKWFIRVLEILHDNGESRFSIIHKALPGISKKMLSSTLQNLERNGITTRLVQMGYPPNVTYKISSRGESLYVALQPLIEWSEKNSNQMQEEAVIFDELFDSINRTPWQR